MASLLKTKKILNAQTELLAIFDSITDPICIIDETLSITRLNQAMADILCLGIKESLGRPCYKNILCVDEPCENCYFISHDREERGCDLIERKSNGTDFIYELTVYPYPDEALKSAIFHYKDVTDKKGLEKNIDALNDLYKKRVREKESEVKKTRQAFEKMVSHTPVGIAILGEKKDFIITNSKFEDIFGYKKNELSGRAFLDILDDNGGAQFQSFFERLSTSGMYSVEISTTDNLGNTLDLVIIGFLLGGSSGNGHDVVVMVQDITMKRLAEEALKDSEETAKVLINATTDSASLIKPDGKIIAINETAAQGFGRSVGELIGINALELYSPDIAKNKKEMIDKVVRSKLPLRFENEQEGRFIDNSLYPVFNSKDKVDRVALFSHDITRQKVLTQELISREALAASGRMLESLSRDLKKPVLGVKNHLSILGAKVKDDREKMSSIDCSMDKLDEVLDLLEMTKGLYLMMKPDREDIDLNGLILNLLGLITSRLGENNIIIKANLSKRIPLVPVYPPMVKQALLHLINNSEDALSSGGTIKMTTRKRGDFVQIVVEDNGRGMDKDTLKMIRDPLYKGKEKKLSLGLYICREVMSKHRGSLEIMSAIAEGTKVTMSFPI